MFSLGIYLKNTYACIHTCTYILTELKSGSPHKVKLVEVSIQLNLCGKSSERIGGWSQRPFRIYRGQKCDNINWRLKLHLSEDFSSFLSSVNQLTTARVNQTIICNRTEARSFAFQGISVIRANPSH